MSPAWEDPGELGNLVTDKGCELRCHSRMEKLYPLLMKPLFDPRPWGRVDLSPIYPRKFDEKIGESWLSGDNCLGSCAPLAVPPPHVAIATSSTRGPYRLCGQFVLRAHQPPRAIELALCSTQLPGRHGVAYPGLGKGIQGLQNTLVDGLELGCDHFDKGSRLKNESGHRGSPLFLVLRDISRSLLVSPVATRRMRLLSARITDPCRQCAHRRV